MEKTRKDKKRKFLKYAALAFLVVFFISGALLFLSIWEKQQGNFPVYDSEEIVVEFNGKDYVLKENVETFLVLGLDQTEETASEDSYNSNRSADFLMLFVFDNNAKKFSAIQINRDTMASINVLDIGGNKINSVTKQIALAPTYGSSQRVRCRNTMDAVSALLLDSKINHYVSLTMESVPILNDLVGGVDVTVLHDFSGIDDTLKKGQKVSLKGEQALRYVQSRSGLEENDNISRMERQKQYISAFYNKAIESAQSDEDFIVNAFSELSKQVGSNKIIDSDRSVTQLQELAKKFTEYEFTGVQSIDGDSKKGEEFMEFYADTDSIKKITIENFYEIKK